MFFSVIVPIYNVDKYLEKCLHSIQQQKFTDFECILVDDGSSDKSPYICDRYAEDDSRFIVLHKKNGGLVSARQAGANMSRGNYVVCVDGDDWIDNNYLFRFATIIEQQHPDVVCCGSYKYFSHENNKKAFVNIKKGFYDRKQIEKNIFPFLVHDLFGNYFSPSVWAKAFKRELYVPHQMLLDTKIAIGEDIACTYSCIFYANSIYCTDDCLYFYRQNDQSMTHKKVFDIEGPKLVGKHLEEAQYDLPFDFNNQIDRLVVHLLFNCMVTQFYKPDTYGEICKMLNHVLDDEYYSAAIKNCYFSRKYIKGNMALFAMKHRLYYLLKLYSVFFNTR